MTKINKVILNKNGILFYYNDFNVIMFYPYEAFHSWSIMNFSNPLNDVYFINYFTLNNKPEDEIFYFYSSFSLPVIVSRRIEVNQEFTNNDSLNS